MIKVIFQQHYDIEETEMSKQIYKNNVPMT